MTGELPRAERVGDGDNGRPFEELRTAGLLWLINRAVFHPRGYALALHFTTPDGTGPCTGWSMIGDGAEPWQYAEAESDGEDACFQAVEAFLAGLREHAHGDEVSY